MKTATQSSALATMALSMIFGGTIVVFTKGASAGLAVLLIGAIRFLAQFMIFSSLWRRAVIIHRRKYFKALALHCLMHIASITCWLLAIERSQALTIAMIFAVMPLLVYLGAVLFLKEKASIRGLIGTVIALIGSLVIIVEPFINDSAEVASFSRTGALFAVAALIFTTLQILSSKRVLAHGNEIPMLAIRSLTIVVVLGIVAAFQGQWPELLDTDTSSLLNLGGVIIGGSLAHLLFFHSLQRVRAQDASSLLFIEVLTGVVLGALILNETFTNYSVIGSFVIVLGILTAHPIHYRHYLSIFIHAHNTPWGRLRAWLNARIQRIRKQLVH